MPWHPLLFTTVIVMAVWLESAVSPYAIVRSLVVAVLVAAVLTATFTVLLRSLALGGLAATGVIWLLWSKHLVEIGATAFDRLGPLAVLWLAAIVVVLVLAFRLVARRARSWTAESVTTFLNRAGGLMLAATLILGVIGGKLPAIAGDLRQGTALDDWAASGAGTGPSAERPDIYAMLLDGYPRTDVLDDAFNIDNARFIRALEDRGFDIAELAHSDYIWTHVSLPSVLNMAYVEQIPALNDVIVGNAARQPALRHAITQNEAFDAAREQGYDTVAVASGFEEVTARQADVYVDGGQMTELEVSLLASTFAGDLIGLVAPDLASSQHRARILGGLDALPDIAATRDRPPALVFAHIPAPHEPVVFGEGGDPVAVPISDDFYADSPMEQGEDPEDFRDRYRAQLPYLNDRILEAIDGIIEHSSAPPVIVLFADHGSSSRTDWNQTDPAHADPVIVLERTGILTAALTPGHETVYPEDVSPVDLFRLLFDAYFGTEYGRALAPADGGHIPAVDASVLDGD